ncbi:MAG: FixH family protein [Chitinophagales bacterium]|nr:FixH family protein [Chitinophagales bacterium]
MKISWGYRVAILYCSFVAFMLFLVFKSHSEDFSLVTKDYYKQEIQYQQQIDKQKNSAALSEKLSIEFSQAENKARFSFPKNKTPINGTILFYRPSDSKQDLKVVLQPNAENQQDVSFASLQKGLWRVQVDWTSGDTAYFDEKTLVIQ